MTGAILRCKLHVVEVLHSIDEHGEISSERVRLAAVYGKEGTENAQWSKWTPSAQFEITINNPEAINHLSKGHEYFVDFIPVPTEVIP